MSIITTIKRTFSLLLAINVAVVLMVSCKEKPEPEKPITPYFVTVSSNGPGTPMPDVIGVKIGGSYSDVLYCPYDGKEFLMYSNDDNITYGCTTEYSNRKVYYAGLDGKKYNPNVPGRVFGFKADNGRTGR